MALSKAFLPFIADFYLRGKANFGRKLFYRGIRLSKQLHKIVPDNLKNKSSSSQAWLTRHLNDPYIKKTRYESYRCRSAFKLLEINEKYKILRPGLRVVECGAAPGSWTQVIVKNTIFQGSSKGMVIAVDLKHMERVEGAIVLKEMDFTEKSVQEHICSLLPYRKADVVLSDMAPNATGVKDLDHDLITVLNYSALQFSVKILEIKGTFLCKMWNGDKCSKLAEDMERFFSTVKFVKPNSSYSNSSEVFLLARDFKGVKSPVV